MFSGRTGMRMLRFALPALLILLVLAGLRGATSVPGWSGRYHGDGVPIGVTLEIVFGVLLVALLVRGWRSAPGGYVAVRLHRLMRYLLTGGLVAIPLVMLFANWHPKPVPPRHVKAKGTGRLPKPPAHPKPGGSLHVPLADILYGLLVALLLAAVVWCWVMVRRRLTAGDEDELEPDPGGEPEGLGAAVESGRAALMLLDDARAAIIACYVAMEQSLAEAGAARAVADTPDELLARAVAAGLASVEAASRLTALFYEARFSTHPLGRAQRDEAERALTEIAASVDRQSVDRQSVDRGETVVTQG